MKIKDVCTRTGLSERTVRFYCEQNLLSPEKHEVRGRVYLDFDEKEIAVLQQIAALRSAGMSIDEIRTVQNEPYRIAELLDTLRGRLEREQGEQDRILACLDTVQNNAAPTDMESLAAMFTPRPTVRPYTNGAARRDGEISFREFCEQGYVETAPENDLGIQRGKWLFVVYSVWYWLGFCSVLLNLLVRMTAGVGGALLAFLISTAIWLWLYVYLYRGALWARVVHVIRAVVMAITELLFLPGVIPHLVRHTYHTLDEMGNTSVETVYESTGSWYLVAILAVVILLDLAAAYLLTFNEWVRDYLYDRSTQ